MQRDDHRLEQQGHGPHSQRGLQRHDAEQQGRQGRGSGASGFGAPGVQEDAQNQQAEGAGEIAVDHFLPGLGGLDRALRIGLICRQLLMCLIGNTQPVTVAAGPVRAAETGIGKADVSAERDDAEGKDGGGKQQTTIERHGSGVSEHDQAVGKKGGEQQGQVKNRIAESATRQRVAVIADERDGVAEENQIQQADGHQIEPARHAE